VSEKTEFQERRWPTKEEQNAAMFAHLRDRIRRLQERQVPGR
jgi:hypothetical protein